MSMVEIIVLGVALAMDAFAVTISNAFCYRGASRARLFVLPIAFGVFQGLMPLLGFFLGGNHREYYRGVRRRCDAGHSGHHRRQYDQRRRVGAAQSGRIVLH